MCFSNSILLVQVAKVYVSVFGDERGKEVAMAGLKAKAKYVRSQLGRRMKLRLTPEIRFIEDESFERGSRVRIMILGACCYGYTLYVFIQLQFESLCSSVSTLFIFLPSFSYLII
jgi:hypothetical protein